MRQLLNTLYVTRPRTYLRLDHDTVKVECERELVLQAPLLQLGSIVTFGDALITSALIERCAEDGRAIVLLDERGRFRARVEGPMSGNVLLRRAQHRLLDHGDGAIDIVRAIVAGKLRNARTSLLRAARDATDADDKDVLTYASRDLRNILDRLETRDSIDMIRGDEGEAARVYFGVFNAMIKEDRLSFAITGRTRRPPLDPTNAVLSFLYTLLRSECASALEGVGLDPQMGFLHALRPGRPALALDLMEEFRPVLADRLALTLINRKELRAGDFERQDGGAVLLNDDGRRKVILAWQDRKTQDVPHRVLKESVPIGLLPHVQARLLARAIRGEMPYYVPWVQR